MDIKAIIALALSCAALLVVIISMATDHWADDDAISVSVGLWKLCGPDACLSVKNLPDWWKGVQAAVCLAFISNLGAAVTLALFALVSSIPQKITKMASLVLLGVATFWNSIAIVVYAAEYSNSLSGVDLSWSWGIAILAIILEIVALVFTVLASREAA